MISLEIPQLFVPKFGFNPQQIGLQFAGIIIGTLIGEQCGGPFSDYLMNSRSKKLGRRAPAEFRLWACHLGFLTVVVGMIVFGVQLQNLQPNRYNVTPVVGAGLAIFGLQVITTVLITYAVDSNLELSSSIGVFVTFIRQTWSFVSLLASTRYYFTDGVIRLAPFGSRRCLLLWSVSSPPCEYL